MELPQLGPDVLATPFRSDLFRGRVAVVTGGGTGIGRAIALELASLGAGVALCGRRAEPIETLAHELTAAGHPAFAQSCDIRDNDQIASFVDATLARLGRIDVLVNNAGGQFPSPVVAMSPKGFEAVVRNNLVGTFQVTHAIGTKAMVPARRGRIVNITANVSRGFPGMAHTGAARAGVENLTRSLAVEWAPYGIQVNAVAPGTIVSSGTERYPAFLMERAQAKTPARRLGVVEEVSHLVVYLSSDAAQYITGAVIPIDGALSLWGDIWEPFDAGPA